MPVRRDAEGQLADRFASLDGIVAQFRSDLADAWRQTVLIMVIEFGRSVAMNGTRGSDHGVAGAAFIMGERLPGGGCSRIGRGLKRFAV